jgi:peptide/nickel transport system ATP-binding protein
MIGMNVQPSAGSPGTHTPLLDVRDVRIDLRTPSGPAIAVEKLTFAVGAREILGVIGESGSGKSLSALAIVRMLPVAAQTVDGQVLFQGRDLLTLDDKAMRRVRGREIGIIFQDPLAYLHPLKRVGKQVEEVLTIHGVSPSQAHARAVELLTLVGIKNAKQRMDDYPHQFSGGMRQRVMIAMAVAHNPSLVIADEPTTALDVTVQQEILALLKRLRDELGTAVVLITHDMSIVEQTCDNVVVMYSGHIAEAGAAKEVLARPRHPYSRELLLSVPRLDVDVQQRLPAIPGQPPDPAHRPSGCPFNDRCPDVIDKCHSQMPPLLGISGPSQTDGHAVACWVAPLPSQSVAQAQPPREPTTEPAAAGPTVVVDDIRVGFRQQRGLRRLTVVVLDGISLDLRPGRATGLVGESGSGKSTLARVVLGLQPVDHGRVVVSGHQWTSANDHDRAQMRRDVQMVFQDAYAAMNPRMRVHDIVAEPIRNFRLRRASEVTARVHELLDRVGLAPRHASLLPYQLSGGQRQRVGIARALAVEPRIVVADEPVSSLDVSVQAQVINLFADLRDDLGVGYLFITHDLAVARHLCDDIAVLYRGRIVEQGPAADIFHRPQHPYTSALLASAAGGVRAAGRAVLAGLDGPADGGCRFSERCPVGPLVNPSRTRCVTDDPALELRGAEHLSACHFPGEVRNESILTTDATVPEFVRDVHK